MVQAPDRTCDEDLLPFKKPIFSPLYVEYADEIFNPHPLPHMHIIRIFRIRMANPNVHCKVLFESSLRNVSTWRVNKCYIEYTNLFELNLEVDRKFVGSKQYKKVSNRATKLDILGTHVWYRVIFATAAPLIFTSMEKG